MVLVGLILLFVALWTGLNVLFWLSLLLIIVGLFVNFVPVERGGRRIW